MFSLPQIPDPVIHVPLCQEVLLNVKLAFFLLLPIQSSAVTVQQSLSPKGQGMWKRIRTSAQAWGKGGVVMQREKEEKEERLPWPDLFSLVAIEMEDRQLEGLPDREGRYFWNSIIKGKGCIPLRRPPSLAETLQWQLQEDGQHFQKSSECWGCWEFLRLQRKGEKPGPGAPLWPHRGRTGSSAFSGPSGQSLAQGR